MSHSPWRLRAAASLFILCLWTQQTFAAVATWQKGVSIDPAWSGDFGTSEFRHSLEDLAALHANAVSLVIPYYQPDIGATTMAPGWNTPTDASLASGIDAAHALGLQVTLKLHLETRDGQWRANINPTDRQAWFDAYAAVLLHYAAIAEQHHAEQFVLGTELIKMTSEAVDPANTQHWQSLIAQARSVFSGALTYGANHGGNGAIDEKNVIGFWADLDSIGLSAYHPLTTQENHPSIDALKAAWDQWNMSEIRPLAQKYHKPVVFTEVGYRSITGAHKDPSNWAMGGCYDPAEQARDYDALFSYWNADAGMQGVFFWDWKSKPGTGGRGDTGFTPQGKPAENVLRQWFTTGAGFADPSYDRMEDGDAGSSFCTAGFGGAGSSLSGAISSSASGTGGGTSGGGSGNGGGVGGNSGGSNAPGSAGGGPGGGSGGGNGGSGGAGGGIAPPGGGGPSGGPGGGSPPEAGIPPPSYGGATPVLPMQPPAAGKGAPPAQPMEAAVYASLISLILLLRQRRSGIQR